MSEFAGPSRTFAGTGNRTIDIDFMDLPDSDDNDLAKMIEVKWIKMPEGGLIDWATSTEASLVLLADPGQAWEIEIVGRDHKGLGNSL